MIIGEEVPAVTVVDDVNISLDNTDNGELRHLDGSNVIVEYFNQLVTEDSIYKTFDVNDLSATYYDHYKDFRLNSVDEIQPNDMDGTYTARVYGLTPIINDLIVMEFGPNVKQLMLITEVASKTFNSIRLYEVTFSIYSMLNVDDLTYNRIVEQVERTLYYNHQNSRYEDDVTTNDYNALKGTLGIIKDLLLRGVKSKLVDKLLMFDTMKYGYITDPIFEDKLKSIMSFEDLEGIQFNHGKLVDENTIFSVTKDRIKYLPNGLTTIVPRLELRLQSVNGVLQTTYDQDMVMVDYSDVDFYPADTSIYIMEPAFYKEEYELMSTYGKLIYDLLGTINVTNDRIIDMVNKVPDNWLKGHRLLLIYTLLLRRYG